VVESESLNIFKSKLQRLHDIDESFLGNICPIDSGGRASSPGEASSGELSGELFLVVYGPGRSGRASITPGRAGPGRNITSS